LGEIAGISAILPELDPVLLPRKSAVAKTPLPQLRELQFAVESFRDGLIRYVSEEVTPVAKKEKKRFFVADAFTNPSHQKFALKVTASAMICYLIYSGLDWPGLNTSFLTCCFIALENTGATIRRGWLRLIGSAIGGSLGYLAIFFCIPYMDSLTSLVLLTAAGAAIIGWIQEAEFALRACEARQLQLVAVYIETGHCPQSAELESAFTEWSRIIPPPAENDRPRLVRRIVEQIRQFQ